MSYGEKQRDRATSVYSALCRDLQLAIDAGHAQSIKSSLSRQELNDVTEDVSNHLLLRSFLAGQKSTLLELRHNLSVAESRGDLYLAINDCITTLENRFESNFISENADYPYAKTTGDTLFREVMSMPAEYLPHVARLIAQTDKGSLIPPKRLYELAEKATQDIVADLRPKIESLSERPMRAGLVSELEERALGHIEELDVLLITNLPRAEMYD